MKYKHGFTLTEILAVVLIIGILSALALPQYRRAIEKARATEAISMLRVMHDSAERVAIQRGYRDLSAWSTLVQNNNAVKIAFEQMDMFDQDTIKCSFSSGGTTMTCENFTYTIGGTLTAARNGSGTSLEFVLYPGNPPVIKCRAQESVTCDPYGLPFEANSVIIQGAPQDGPLEGRI